MVRHLILTGVIQDDVKEVQEMAVLGDIPLIGQLFRKTSNTREKRELVVVVTPVILNDAQGGGTMDMAISLQQKPKS